MTDENRTTDRHGGDEYCDRLIHGHFDDVLDDAGRREFADLLRDSEAARRRFWALAEVHALAHDAALAAWPGGGVDTAVDMAVADPAPPRPVVSFASIVHSRLRPLGLVAAGLALGVFMTGLAWAITRPRPEPVKVLLAENFESAVPLLAVGVPTAPGAWSGDVAELVEAQSGVEPAGGRQMLRFLSADYAGKPNPGGYIGEMYRLIDVREHRGDSAGGDAIVQVSALFNAARPDAQAAGDAEKYHYSLSLYALDAAAAADGSNRGAAAQVERALAVTRRSNDVLDHDPRSWQKMSAELRLPSNADFLLLRIAVAHAGPSRNAGGRDTFAAHYADEVRVVLAHRPELP